MFHQPLTVSALGSAALGLILSLPDTSNAFMGVQLINYLPPVLAQSAVVMLAIASAGLYRQRWPFFIEPFIAFLPVTLFFVGYGEQIFGQALTTPQYALIWTALSRRREASLPCQDFCTRFVFGRLHLPFMGSPLVIYRTPNLRLDSRLMDPCLCCLCFARTFPQTSSMAGIYPPAIWKI
jgi:hypothetical protein